MEPQPSTDLQRRLIALLRAGSALQTDYTAGLTPEERDAIGQPARWSAKDLAAHMTAWKARRLRQLEAVIAGGDAPALAIQETNDATWDELAGQSWEEIAAEEARVIPALSALIGAMSDADLLAPDRYPSLPYQPAALIALRPAYAHVVQHLAEHHSEAGEPARAIALRQTAATALDAFPEFPELAAAPHYNLACHYAAAQPDQALSELRRALAWNSALASAAREDPDLASLHGDARFTALVANT